MTVRVLSLLSATILVVSCLLLVFSFLKPKATKYEVKPISVGMQFLLNEENINYLKSFQGSAVKSMTSEIITDGVVKQVSVSPLRVEGGREFQGAIKLQSENKESVDTFFTQRDLGLTVVMQGNERLPGGISAIKVGDHVLIKKIFDLTKPTPDNTVGIFITKI